MRRNEELEVLFLGLLCDNRGEIFQNILEPEFGVLDVEFTRLDFGEVENVIDDAEQRPGGRTPYGPKIGSS